MPSIVKQWVDVLNETITETSGSEAVLASVTDANHILEVSVRAGVSNTGNVYIRKSGKTSYVTLAAEDVAVFGVHDTAELECYSDNGTETISCIIHAVY